MQIDAHKRTLSEVLQQGQHIVPRYQRRYAWESQNIKDFWNDITTANEPHFLGSMVTSGAASMPREIIDGQQRLTTAVIALSALRDRYTSLGNLLRASGVGEFLEFVDRNGERAYRLKNRDSGASARLNDNILLPKERRAAAPGHDSECLESLAYAEFDHLLTDALRAGGDEIAILDGVRDAVLETEVVYINVEDRKNAFTIFETLNDRGQSLTVMDLVKNLLFSEIPQSDEDSSERSWSAILQRVDDLTVEGITLDYFLYYAWNSRFHPGTANSDTIEQVRLRRSIADHLSRSGDPGGAARSLISELSHDAQVLSALNATLTSNGSPDAWRDLAESWRRDKFEEISERLYGILVTGASQPFPLLLALMRAYFRPNSVLSARKLVSFLTTIEAFQFRWSIAQKPSTATIRRLYRQAAASIDEASTRSAIDSTISVFRAGAAKLDATDSQFRDGLARLAYSRTRSKDAFKVRFVLARMERKFPTTKLDLSRQLSMEHLQGQEGRSEATPRNSWIFKLGNLALVPPHINSTLPKDFTDKCSELGNWINSEDVVLTEALSTGSWKSEQANERLGFITQQALELWPRSEAA